MVCKNAAENLKTYFVISYYTIYQLGSCQSIKKALSIFLKVPNFLEPPAGTSPIGYHCCSHSLTIKVAAVPQCGTINGAPYGDL